MENINKRDDERFDDYFVRLFHNRREYGLTLKEVSDLLNQANGSNFDESKWRKEYAAFARGVAYAKRTEEKNVATRLLCVSDLHVPFQLPTCTFADFCGQADILVINGDVSDCQAISKFPKSYRVSPMDEIIATRAYLIELISCVCPSRVIINYGNHDIRFQSYLSKSLDTDLLELMPQTALNLIVVDGFNHYDKRNSVKTHYSPISAVFPDIEITYTDNWFCQVGKTMFCHPIAYSSAIMKTAEKALLYFRNEGYDFNALVMGHTHKIGQYKIGNTTIIEQGCCCDTSKQHYADGKLTNSQKEGFVYLCQDANGNLIKEYTKIKELN